MPGAVLANITMSEMLTHSWDLARATGQRLDVADVDVEDVLAGVKKGLKPEAREPGFGPEVQPPEGAPPIDQLAAFLGRLP